MTSNCITDGAGSHLETGPAGPAPAILESRGKPNRSSLDGES